MKITTSRKGQKCGKSWETRRALGNKRLCIHSIQALPAPTAVSWNLYCTSSTSSNHGDPHKLALFRELLDIYYLCRPPKKRIKITEESDEGGEFKQGWQHHLLYNRSCQNILPPSNKSEHKLGLDTDCCISLNYISLDYIDLTPNNEKFQK